jgi:hypothetical protein
VSEGKKGAGASSPPDPRSLALELLEADIEPIADQFTAAQIDLLSGCAMIIAGRDAPCPAWVVPSLMRAVLRMTALHSQFRTAPAGADLQQHLKAIAKKARSLVKTARELRDLLDGDDHDPVPAADVLMALYPDRPTPGMFALLNEMADRAEEAARLAPRRGQGRPPRDDVGYIPPELMCAAFVQMAWAKARGASPPGRGKRGLVEATDALWRSSNIPHSGAWGAQTKGEGWDYWHEKAGQ